MGSVGTMPARIWGPASDGRQMGLMMGRQRGPDEAPLPGAQGGLVHQRPAGMPSEPPGKAAEPLHEQQPAAWEGRLLPTSGLCALQTAPGECSRGEKLQLCQSSFLGIFKKQSLWGRGSVFIQSCT